MERKKYFLRMLALLALMLPWALQAQNAKVSEYDYSVSTAAYTSIASTGTAWTTADVTAGHVDIDLPFAMYLGENQAAANSTVSVYPDGHVELNGLTGAEIAPLQYAAGYNATATSIYYQAGSTELTVEWRKVVASGNALSFQLKLHPNGDIQFCYGPMGLSTSINVFAGIQADGYIFRVGGSDWSDITRYTSGTSTRALNGSNHPAYDIATGMGAVYTFTQPACVKPTGITATALAWDSVQVDWTVTEPGVKYQVAYSTEPVFDPNTDNFPASQIVTINDPNATSVIIGGLSSYTTYFFAVRKFCNATTPSGWLFKSTGTATPQSCPSPTLSNFSLSAGGVASWTLGSYPNITTVDIYYSTENVAPDDETAPSVTGIAATTAQYDLTTQNLESATPYYVWFRGHCTVEGGSNTNWVGPRSFTTPCGAITITGANPFTENFDSYSTSATYSSQNQSAPSCWETYSFNTSGTANGYLPHVIYSGASYNYSSSQVLSFYGSGTQYAVLPQFANPLNQLQISFDYATESQTTTYIMTLGYITEEDNNMSSFTEIQSFAPSYHALTPYEISLANVPATAKRLVFRWTASAQWSANIENVLVELLPTCLKPVISNVTSDGLVSWDAISGTASYEVVCVPTGDDVSTGTVVNAGTGTSYQLTGLESATTYDVYLRSRCSATDQSRWSIAYTFTTACVALHIPYSEDFTNYDRGGSYGYSGPSVIPTCWDIYSNGSNTALTTGSSYFGGVFYYNYTSSYAAMETYNNYICLPIYVIGANTTSSTYVNYHNQRGDTKVLALPLFSEPLSSMMISFNYKIATANSSTGQNTALELGYITNDDMSTFQTLETYPATTNTTQTVSELPLSTLAASAPAGARLAFKYSGTHNGTATTSGAVNYCGIDNVVVDVIPTCPTPKNLTGTVSATSVNLTWNTNGSTASQWEIEYGPRGFQLGSGFTTTSSTNAATINYLDVQTEYDAYVRGICAADDQSEWSDVFEFATPCPAGGSLVMGDATSYMQGLPVYNYYDYSISEQIYTANEMGGAKTITTISYYVNATGTDRDPVAIYLGETTKSEFTSTTDWVSTSDMTLVYNGNLVTSQTGWQTVTLTTPFAYSGENNLIVVFDNNDGGYSGQPTFGVMNTASHQSIWQRRDNTDYDPTNMGSITSQTLSNLKNNFIFNINDPCLDPCAPPQVAIEPLDYSANLTFTNANGDEANPTFGYICVPAGTDPTTGTAHTTTQTTATVTGLQMEEDYDLYVYSVCGGTEGRMTRHGFSTVFVPSCQTPTGVTASNVTNSTATVSWTQPANSANSTAVDHWTVRYATEAIADMAAATADQYTELPPVTGQPTVDLTGLAGSSTYYIYVKATCALSPLDESQNWSDAGTFTTLCPAPVDVAFGDADSYMQGLPVYNYYDYSISEQIYTVDELGGANTYSTISYFVQSTGTDRNPVVIYMGETNKSSFSSSSDWVPASSLTQVYSGNLVTSQTGWQTVVLDTPFNYTGNGNLIVMFDNNDGEYSGQPTFGVINTDENQSLWNRQDNTDYNPNNLSGVTSYNFTTIKNNFKFGGCDATVTCISPKDVTAQVSTTNEVTLTWATRENLMPVPTTFEVRYDVAGTPVDECANVITDITALNATFANVTKNTDYVVYVASKCGANDYSPWQSKTFTTNPSCWDPNTLSSSAVTANSVTLTWNNNETVPASRWQISYAKGYNDDPEAGTIVDATNNEGTEITGLSHSSAYTFYVRAMCDEIGEDVSNWVGPYQTYTDCGAYGDDLPYNEDFTVSVDNMPWCWSKLPATGTYPNSNDGNLFFNNNSSNDLYAILPAVAVNPNTLDMVFDLYFDGSETLLAGVMSDPADAETFVPVVTINSADYTLYEYNKVTIQLADYTGTGSYIAFKIAGASNYNYTRIDNLTLKVREASHVLADNGGTASLCDEYLIPTINETTNTYNPNVNATYIITPAEAGKVLKLQGDYSMEYGYDFLDVYEGIGADATLVASLTGKGNFEYKTESNDWVAKGGVKLVFRTDADNAMPNLNGFHFLATCECPETVAETENVTVEANGTYTWTAPNGNGETYTHNVVLTGLTYGEPEETVADIVETYAYVQANVAGCDSVNKELNLTLHPTYSKTYNAEICERETFSFYGQEFTTTGTYTVPLTSVFGADSIGILNLQVHAAPTVAITYNGRAYTTYTDFCDNADMALVARSQAAGATYVWEDRSTDANRVVNPHESNTYSVVATEPTYGCTSLPATLKVTTTPVPALSITATNDVICRGNSTTLTLTDANNTAATYTWKANGVTLGSQATLTVSPTETTTYTATATTSTGACVATAEYTITVNQLPVVAATASVSTICSDSIITLNATPVEGYSYLWNTGATTATATTVANATTDYSVIVTDANGCVNEFTTATVTVRPSYERSVNMDVCYTQNPYTWGNKQLTADGEYDQMFTAQNGCDSLIHLTFAFQQMSVYNTPREVCEGTVLTWGPETVTATENTVVSYVLQVGDADPNTGVALECPAQYNLNLTVNHPTASSFDRTVCDSTTWNVSGLTYYESGAYPYTLATTKGCDSVVTMNLTVNYHVYNDFTVEHACDSYTWNNETYTEAGDYVQNFAGYQCDSTTTLHLMVVDKTTYGTDNILYCGDPESWIAGNTAYKWIDGVTYTMSETDGNITYTLRNANEQGCDSVATLNLTLNPVAEVLNWVNVSACDEFSIDTISCDGVVGTKYINQSGDYQFRTPTATAGRDVLTQIHLTIEHSSYHTNLVTACVPYDWRVVVGQDPETGEDIEYLVGTYNESGTISYQLPDQYSANGCSRIEVLRLTALMPTEEITNAVICQNGSWTSPDESVTLNGADLELGENTKLWQRTTNDDGCNLDKKVVLTVNPVYDATAELTFCESDFINNELTIANALNANDEPVVLTITGALDQTPYSNTVVANWKTQSGCDSVVTINYTVNPTTYETVPVATCYRYTWDANGMTYTESGEYTFNDEGANIYHCDNFLTLQLTLNDSVVDYETEYHCSEYEYDGEIYRQTQTFREILEPTAEGCEHIRYITHAVIPTQMTDLYVVTNVPYTWQNGVTYTESIEPVYYETTTLEYAATNDPANVTTCDSILVLHLTIVDDTAEFCENELPYNYTAMGITLDGTTSSLNTWTNVPDLDLMQNTDYYFFGTNGDGQWTQWRTRFLAGEHNGMLTVNGTEFANYQSEYVTVDLVVNGETKATKTLHNLPSLNWITVNFDTPVRINDNDVVDFVYTAESQYAIYTVVNDNGIIHPNNYQLRYSPDGEWYSVGENNGLYFNFNMWYNFGIDDGYYYIRNTEDHHDTILYYVVNRNANVTLNETACDSYTWDATGQTYTESGVYNYQTTTSNGCDSNVVLNLTINQNSTATLDAVEACDEYVWIFNGVTIGTYTQSGNHTYSYTDDNNCPSVATLPLTINNSQNVTLDAVEACDTYTWMYNNETVGTYTESGDKDYSYNDATTGCAVNVTLPLTINASTEREQTVVVNAASTYYPDENGNYYPASETPYTFDYTGTNAAGCNETVHVTLIVHQGATVDVEVNACGEYTWETADNGNGHTYKWISNAERQQYGALYMDITDPANPVYVHVGDNPTFATYNPDNTVNTTYVLWLNFSEAGYMDIDLGDVLLSQQSELTVKGDGSLDEQTIDLSEYIAAKQDATLNVTLRHNDPSNYYCGYFVTYTANLVWNYNTVEATICDADTYTWAEANETFAVSTANDFENGGNMLTHVFNAGTPNEMVTTMKVTVTPRTNSDPQVVDSCFTYTWTAGTGETYTTSGTYTWNDDANCTLETLSLTIYENSSYTATPVVVCDSYTWAATADHGDGQTYTATGDITNNYTDANGCPATVTLPLTINKNHGHSMVATACDSYSWNANDGQTYVLDATQTKVVAYTDVNTCRGYDTIRLTINNSTNGIDVQNACGSFEWIVNNETVGTYTESNNTASYTIANGNAAGCDSTVTLNLTVYNPRVFSRDQYAYGSGITINGQFYVAPANGVAQYNLVLDTVDPEANNCATVVNVTLYVSQYEYFYTNYVACGYYTWTVNNHDYRYLTDAELAANPTALYFDVTDNAVVTSNPMVYDGNRIDVLNLTINRPSVTNVTRTVPMSQLEAGHTLTLDGNVEDFSNEFAAHQNATVTRSYSLGTHAACDSIVNYTINLVWNYDTVTADVCDMTSYTWTEANETFAVNTGVNYIDHVFNAGTENEQVTTLKLTVQPRTEDPQTPVTVCDSYTWHGTEYTASANLEYNDDENCTHETLALTINTNAGSNETFEQCFTYTWNVPTYELDATTGNYVAADDITNTYTESGVKTVTFTDANGCQGTATLNLTINADQSETLAAVSACDSYEWTYNNVVVDTYTESGDKTYNWTDEHGCAATTTLPLTINYTATQDVELWEGEGSYRYVGIFAPATPQMLNASSTPYTFTETVAGATTAGCDSIYNITLHVGNSDYTTETYRSCNTFTWNRNEHTYVRLTAAQAAENPTALYYDETADEIVYYNPTVSIPNEGTYNSVFMLQLTLDAVWDSTAVVNFPVSKGILNYKGRSYDFTVSSEEGRNFTGLTKVDTIHLAAQTFCDSIYYVTINVYNNYREVETADICATTDSYTWRGQTINTATNDYDNEHTYYIYDGINANDSVEYITITQHPVTYATERREACDSYTWELNGQTYTNSTSNETYLTQDEYGCEKIVTLTLTINHSSSNYIETAACETYTWKANNAEETVIGTYTATPEGPLTYSYISDEGCPSTDTLVLTINHNTSTEYTVDACDSYTWTAEEGGDGRVLTASSVETYEYNTIEGCPSTNTLNLTVRYNSNQTIEKTVCDSYTWTAADGGDGRVLDATGTYTYDYYAANGCPSTNTLNLTINTNAGSQEEATACDTYTWNAPDGESYVLTETQVKTVNYTDLNGCVGQAALNLTINVNEGSVETVAECNEYTWAVNGTTYTTSGDYTATVTDATTGCEGTATLHLTIGQQRVYLAQNVTNCGTYTWIVNDSTLGVFDQSTEASANLPNSLTGCDSVVLLNLTVLNAPVVDEGETVVCESALPFVWEGAEYTQSGVYTKSWALDNTCDSVRTFTLTVTPTIYTQLNDVICLGLDYNANGFSIHAEELTAGEHTFTRTETNATTNCDEVIKLTLTVSDVLSNNVEAVTACDSYSWTAGDGQTYELTASGTYQSQSYPNAMGCATIDVLPLTILTNGGSEETQFACDSYLWNVNGETYTTSGDYTAIITDATSGCEGTATLHLTIGGSEVINTNVTACESYTWTDGDGETYTQSGVYTYNYTTGDNCNGIKNLALTINHSSNTAYSVVACDAFVWNNEEYTVSGDYTFAYNDANNCPSVDTLHLTVNTNSNAGYTETACDSYTWHGSTYTRSGDYLYDYVNAKGCNSTDTLHLKLNYNTSRGETLTACNSYEWHGTTYTQSGTYYYHYNTAEGCASIDTLNLTVNTLSTSEVNETACDSYTWNVSGETYTVSGIYNVTLTSAAGCDSVISLHLTVNNSTNNATDVTACDSYTWNGQTYNTPGVKTYAYTNNAGCPSVDTLHLTLNHSVTGTETAEACNYYLWNGNAYTQSGTYTQTLNAANGCDSVVTLNLTINTQVTENISATACNSYTWNGAVYTSTGVYTQNFTSAAGCDSVVNLALTINQPKTTTLNVTACDSYTWRGTTYNTTGNYNYNTVAANGCDSIVTLALTVNSSTTSSQNVTACDSYIWNGQTYNTSGTYSYNTFAANGCDSVVTLHLTLNNSTTGTVSVTTCGSYTWMDGQTYTTSTNVPTVTLVNANGCDSVVTLNLTINVPISSESYATACGSYTWEGTTYTVSGNYTHNYNTTSGCDSVVTLHLTINNATSSSIMATACESYTWEGVTYTTNGSYTHTYTAANGCDSVVTLQLTINNSTSSSFNTTACGSYTWEGTTYTTSGVYTHTYTAANSCDSVVTMNLTINQPVTSTVYASACDSYTWDGDVYAVTGTYSHTYTALNGCDSVVTLVLTINNSVSTIEEVTECDGFIWIDNVNYTESTNTPTVTLHTVNGCDSVVTLHLTINHSVEIYDTIDIFENQLPYNYHGNTINAAGDYVFSGTTVNGCDSTVYLHAIVRPNTGIEVTSSLDEITVYPNPTRGHSTVSVDDVTTIEVFDIVGHKVAKFENTNQIDISNLAEGTYTLRITTPNGTAVRRLIKK